MCPGDETVGAYVSGTLAGATRSDFEQHLDTCATCQELVAALGRNAKPAATPERDKLGRYEIDSVLGAGGMGVVYRAHDPELGRRVALKVVRPHGDHDQTQARARLVREARAMAKIAHPNVIVVHDAGSVGDEVFIAMELVDGANLADWERASPRPWRDVIDVYLQAARGLAAAHRAGLVHRDFKPHNALIATDGRVRVLDFGLARVDDGPPDVTSEPRPAAAIALAETMPDAAPRASDPTLPAPSRTASADTTLTRTGAIMGSPQYMSPEQHLGERADARSDQFSFCVALYHALYSSYPYAGATYTALATAVADGEAAPAPRATKIPLAIGRVLARGLRRAAAERFATMDDLVAALTAASRRRRTRWIVAGTLAVVAALGATVIVLAARGRPATSAPIAMAFSRNQQMVSSTGDLVATPDLSPDGKSLAFATANGLVVRDLTTGSTRDVDIGPISGIRWAPTSDRVVVSTDKGPVVVPAAGGEPRRYPLDTSTCRSAWSADASEILFGCDGDFGWRIVTVATGAVRPLAIALPATESLDDFDWSAAGIVISTSPEGKVGKSVLWKTRADGTGLVRLADDDLTNCVRWNARGDRFYASRLAKLGTEIVYREIGATAGPAVTVLVQPLASFSQKDTFALSRDERDLIYVQRREWADVILTRVGTAPRALTADHLPKEAVAVTPDGASIIYASGELEHMALYRQPLAGGAAVKIAAPGRFYVHMAASPDGTHVVATSLENHTLRTSVISLADGSSRDLEHPLANFWWPIEWNAKLGIILLADSDKNFIVIDPVTGAARLLWPTDAEPPLFNSALSPDGGDVGLNLPVSGGSSLAVMSVADRSIRILSPVSAQTPVGWSPDGTSIITLEKASDGSQRIVAFSATASTSTFLGVGSRGSWPVALPDGTGIVQVSKPESTDLWLASIATRATLPAGPPTPPAAPPTPPAFHPAPTNLSLTGAAGAAPDGWVAADGAVVSTTCGGPASCVELDAKAGSSISEYVDATPYRGRRVTIEFDARVDKATLFVGMNSGVYAHTELPAGRTGVDDPKWTHHRVTADIAPDSIYVKLKAMTDGDGRAWVANITLK